MYDKLRLGNKEKKGYLKIHVAAVDIISISSTKTQNIF